MSRYYGEWAPYVSVAERRMQAARELAKLRKKGQSTAPVIISGRTIAATFWGKSWCQNLESYRDFENRLERGRSYVRNGSVLDLQVEPLKITAIVSGSSIYKITVSIAAVPKAQWQSICRDCAGGIDTLVELLRGRFSKPVMERLCRQEMGLFPSPSQIKFSCTCPDHASMCKHVAAVLYGVGARLDEKPELLFLLRAVDENDLLTNLDAGVTLSRTRPPTPKILEGDDLSALFGLEMGIDDVPPAKAPAPRKNPRARTTPVDPRPVQPVKVVAKVTRSQKPAQRAPRPIDIVKPPSSAKPTKATAKHTGKRGTPGRTEHLPVKSGSKQRSSRPTR